MPVSGLNGSGSTSTVANATGLHPRYALAALAAISSTTENSLVLNSKYRYLLHAEWLMGSFSFLLFDFVFNGFLSTFPEHLRLMNAIPIFSRQ